jgi:hypothetical protein
VSDTFSTADEPRTAVAGRADDLAVDGCRGLANPLHNGTHAGIFTEPGGDIVRPLTFSGLRTDTPTGNGSRPPPLACARGATRA